MFIKARFRFVEERELSCDLVQFFCMTSETLLIGRPDLFHEIFIIVFQLVKAVLHLADDISPGLVVHGIQFIYCKFPAHRIVLTSRYKYIRNAVKKPFFSKTGFVILPWNQAL